MIESTPIDRYLQKARIEQPEKVEAIISQTAAEYNLELKGTAYDYSIPLPTLKVIYKVLVGVYRRAIRDGKVLEIQDIDSKMTIKYGELYRLLNLEEEQRQIELAEKRMRRARLKFGNTPTRRVKVSRNKKVEPKVLRPLERTW